MSRAMQRAARSARHYEGKHSRARRRGSMHEAAAIFDELRRRVADLPAAEADRIGRELAKYMRARVEELRPARESRRGGDGL